MCTRSITGFAAVLLILVPSAHAWQQAPKPAPEMSQLAHFEGTWSCSGKMNDSPMGPGGAMTSTAEIRRDLGGFWQSGTIKGSMPKQPPFEGRFHTTYDPAGKRYLMLWVDNMGGWSQTTSPGWKGDTLVYEGESHMGPLSMKSRDTFTRSGAAAMKHVWEAELQGKWMTLGEESCKKK
jgi:hypothetical protein